MRTILITGASGVVGRAIAEELHGSTLIRCVHSESSGFGDLDELVACDLTQPRFGLTRRRWLALAERVDTIVHCGGLTTWGLPQDRYETVNVDGTQHVIELAHVARASIFFIGTSFVHALESRSLDVLSDGNVVKPYIWSKQRAEHLLAASDVPYTIFRPTNLVGNSRTGASSRPQIVQMMSDWIGRGKAPYLPAHRGNRVDVAPLDVLGLAVAGAIAADDIGSEYWVTYGDEAMTVRDSLEVIAAHMRDRGRELEPAPVVDPRDGLPVPLDRVPPLSRRFLEVLIDVSEVTHACGGVLPSSLDRLRELYDVPAVADTTAYRRSLDYWAAERIEAVGAR